MKPVLKYLAVFLVGGLLGAGAGFAIGIFVYPYIFLADVVANEPMTNMASRTALARGTFIHADPSDPVHYGSGGVTVYEDAVYLAPDFEVGPGPKYHVYLVPKAKLRRSSDLKGEDFVDLGRLRAFKGSQLYQAPPGTNMTLYDSVIIWCEAFGVLISPADLDKG